MTDILEDSPFSSFSSEGTVGKNIVSTVRTIQEEKFKVQSYSLLN